MGTISDRIKHNQENHMDKIDALLTERGKTYGDAVLTHIRIAEVWSGILQHEVSPYEVALCMAGLKLVRANVNPDHIDSLDDALGYTRIAQSILGP